MKPLILASTSPFRRELLGRLGLPFEAVAPDYEEVPHPELSPETLARVHAEGKALSVARRYPGRIVIGSDQVAEVDGAILGKPGTEEAAEAQLRRMAGRAVHFHTALTLVREGRPDTVVETVTTVLRRLSEAQIRAYVRRDQPLGSAGSFQIETLGIALMERVEGRDYTALIGLPLIALTEGLARLGIDVLTQPS